MPPFDSQEKPEPDVIGTGNADRPPPRWWRYAAAGSVLVLAGILIAKSMSSPSPHAAAPRPSSARTSVSASLSPAPAVSASPLPLPGPSQAWVTALGIANWPMPGSGTGTGTGTDSMFAGGVAGRGGWQLTVRDVARPGQRCAAAVVLSPLRPDARPGTLTYLLPSRPQPGTPVGDLAFAALGAQSPGVGVGFVRLAGPAATADADPARIGGLAITVPFLTERACGQRYYLAGFAYPLAGTLAISVTWNNGSQVHYLVPTRLSRPKVPGLWVSTRQASGTG